VTSLDTIHDVVSITSDPTHLYVAACPTGFARLKSAYVFAMSSSGGAATVLNTTTLWGSPAGLELYGNHLIVAMHPEPEGPLPQEATPMTGIYRVPLASGPAQAIFEGPPLVKPNRMAIVGSTIYIADMDAGPVGSGAIFSLPVTGGTPTVIAQGSPLDDPVGLVATSTGLFIADRGTASHGAEHKDPGQPGKILFLPFGSNQPQVVAQGGLLKNPLDLELVGNTLYIADEGEDAQSKPGVYSLSVSGWHTGVDLTSNIAVVHQGAPFLEPIGLSVTQDRLYVADDTGSKTFRLTVNAAAASPSTLTGGSSQ